MTEIPAAVLLGNLLASYFGDQDDETALAKLRKDVSGGSGTGRALREGLDAALSDPGFDCAGLVRECANRRAKTQEEGRAWLLRLKKALAGAARTKKSPKRRA